MGTRPSVVWHRLRSTYWFVPSVQTVAALLLAAVLTTVDRRLDSTPSWLAWAYGGGADGARALLSAVAGSIITVVSVTFSVTIVALTVSSQHFGPRLLSSFMRDTAAQLVLGTFIGTFAYCLVVLRTVQGEGDGYQRFVPHLSVTMAVVLALLSVAALIYYVHHVSLSLQVSQLTLAVSADLRRAVQRIYPATLGEAAGDVGAPPPPPLHTDAVRATSSGYLQVVDADAIMKVARRHDLCIWLPLAPGAFILPGTRLAEVTPHRAEAATVADAIRAAMVLGPDRTSQQDAGFAVQQLVEVALRALSPGVNEPFTAITCIDRLGEGLAAMLHRDLPPAARADADGRIRVITVVVGFEALLAEAFDPIVTYLAGNPAVAHRLLETLVALARRASRPGDRAAISRQAEVVRTAVLARDSLPGARAAIDAAHRAVSDALQAGPDPLPATGQRA